MCRGRSFRTGRFQLLFKSELRLKARGFVGSPSDKDTGSTALPHEGHAFLTPRGTRRFPPTAMNSRPRDPQTQHRTRARPSPGLPRPYSSKESTCQCSRSGSFPKCGKIPGEGNGYPTPVFLSGEFHGQRSLAGYSPWGLKDQARLRN